MYVYLTLDALVRSFKNAKTYAEKHNRGNEASMCAKVIADLQTLHTLPDEAFASLTEDKQVFPTPVANSVKTPGTAPVQPTSIIDPALLAQMQANIKRKG